MPALLSAQDQLPAAPATPPSNQSPGVFPDPKPLAKLLRYAEKRMGDGGDSDAKNGFYPELGNMVTGAGWISAGPGYRHWLFNDQVLFDSSAAVSWRLYKMAQVRLEMPKVAEGRVVVGTQMRWQDLTQVNHFGEGPDSLESERNEYRLTSTNLVGYTTVKVRPWLSLDGRIGRLGSLRLRDSTGPFRRGVPQTRELFPNDPVYRLGEQPSFVHGEISLAADTRDTRGHPSRGGFYRAAWSTFVDQDRDAFSFRRSELEAAHFIPALSNFVLALRGWLVTSNPPDLHTVPFYLQPSLGGANTLRGYPNYRFHDHNLLLLNAEGRLAVFTHVDAAMFIDAGNVAPRVGDLNLDQTSYGVGLRVHMRGSTVARLDFGRSREGWQILFRTNDPFRASRLSRRTAPVPFAP
jgi:hypothetical protein